MADYEASLARQSEEKIKSPYTIDKLAFVALGGAVSALVVYYIYNSLDEDTKKDITNYIFNSVSSLLPKPTKVENTFADKISNNIDTSDNAEKHEIIEE